MADSQTLLRRCIVDLAFYDEQGVYPTRRFQDVGIDSLVFTPGAFLRAAASRSARSKNFRRACGHQPASRMRPDDRPSCPVHSSRQTRQPAARRSATGGECLCILLNSKRARSAALVEWRVVQCIGPDPTDVGIVLGQDPQGSVVGIQPRDGKTVDIVEQRHHLPGEAGDLIGQVGQVRPQHNRFLIRHCLRRYCVLQTMRPEPGEQRF